MNWIVTKLQMKREKLSIRQTVKLGYLNYQLKQSNSLY